MRWANVFFPLSSMVFSLSGSARTDTAHREWIKYIGGRRQLFSMPLFPCVHFMANLRPNLLHGVCAANDKIQNKTQDKTAHIKLITINEAQNQNSLTTGDQYFLFARRCKNTRHLSVLRSRWNFRFSKHILHIIAGVFACHFPLELLWFSSRRTEKCVRSKVSFYRWTFFFSHHYVLGVVFCASQDVRARASRKNVQIGIGCNLW